MRSVGVPYTVEQIHGAKADAMTQAAAILAELKERNFSAPPDSKIVALIAYLTRLGNPPAPREVPSEDKAEPAGDAKKETK